MRFLQTIFVSMWHGGVPYVLNEQHIRVASLSPVKRVLRNNLNKRSKSFITSRILDRVGTE